MATSKTSSNNLTFAEFHDSPALATDPGLSTEDDSPGSDGEEADHAREAVAVSIGYQQSRLTSPTTPAVEKAAALDKAGGFFAGSFDGSTFGIADTIPEHDLEEDLPTPDGATTPDALESRQTRFSAGPADRERLPSPWRAGPKHFQRDSKTKFALRDGFSFARKRSSSGPDSFQKSFFATFPSMPSLPSMPKDFSFKSPFASTRPANDSKLVSEQYSASTRYAMPWSANGSFATGGSAGEFHGMDNTLASRSSRNSAGALPYGRANVVTPARRLSTDLQQSRTPTGRRPPEDVQLRQTPTRLSALRRSTSDTSLVTRRTLSHVSSLGDDSRFESIHDQVNSRFKAIKDSFADSSLRLPGMPSMPNFNMSSNFLNRDRSSFSASTSTSDNLPTTSVHDKRHSVRPIDPVTRQPYASAKAAISDMNKASIAQPHFTEALKQLEGDIVVLGGYRGSILRSAEPPHRQLWVPIKVGLNLRKADLEVGISEDDDYRASAKVIPGGMLTHIGPVDMSRRLLKRLRSCDNVRNGKLRVHEYGYDWRLHPAFLSRQIVEYLEKLPCNRIGTNKRNRGALVVAHSLGGLLTRHAVNQRPDLFAGVVYAGVPKTCVNILGPIRNGDEVLLSSRVLTAQVNFTIRTSFALLPLNGRCFFDKDTKEEYPIDFFDPQTWIDHRLSPCIARALPPLTTPAKPTGITGYVSSMVSALPSLSLPGRAASETPAPTTTAGILGPTTSETNSRVAAANGNIAKPGTTGNEEDDTYTGPPSVRTMVTIPQEEAIQYLTRTLRTVKKFKEELAFDPAHHASNAYPPISVIYGKTTPTVFGAKVQGREGIKHADAYDELAFASGDGVVLAKAAMVPEGYQTARGGVVSSDRGHVTLLGDLEAVGRCINAVIKARIRGVGIAA